MKYLLAPQNSDFILNWTNIGRALISLHAEKARQLRVCLENYDILVATDLVPSRHYVVLTSY